jgi:hypothetical protein
MTDEGTAEGLEPQDTVATVEGEAWLLAVPPDHRLVVVQWLTARGWPAEDARLAFGAGPIPVRGRDAEESVAALEALGAEAEVRPAPKAAGGRWCPDHPVHAVALCERCGRGMCRMCARRGVGGKCTGCATREAENRARGRRLGGLIIGAILIAAALVLFQGAPQPAAPGMGRGARAPLGDAGALGAAPASGDAGPADAARAMPGRAFVIPDIGPTIADPAEADAGDPEPPPPTEGGLRIDWRTLKRTVKRGQLRDAERILAEALAAPHDPATGEALARWLISAVRKAEKQQDAGARDRLLSLGLRFHFGARRGSLLVMRARIQADAGNLAAAMRDLREVKRTSEVASVALWRLADLQHRAGQLAESRKTLEVVARLNGPHAARARTLLESRSAMAEVSDGYHEVRSGQFVVRVPPNPRGGSAAQMGARVMRTVEDGYRIVRRALGEVSGEPIPVFAYTSEDFARRFGRSRGLLGVYSSADRALSVNDITGSAADADGRETLVHELTHAVVDRLTGGRSIPRWLNEGLARYLGREGAGREPVSDLEWLSLKELAKQGRLPALRTLRHRYAAGGMTYLVGVGVAAYIKEKHGFDTVRRYLASRRTGTPHEQAFQRAFGMGEAELERRFREAVAERSTGRFSAR